MVNRLWLPESWIEVALGPELPCSFVVASPFHRRIMLTASSLSLRNKWADVIQTTIHKSRKSEKALAPCEITAFPYRDNANDDDLSLVSIPAGPTETTTAVIKALVEAAPEAIRSALCKTEMQLLELTSHGLQPLLPGDVPGLIKSAGMRCHLMRSRCQFVLVPRDVGLSVDMLPHALKCLITHHVPARTSRSSTSLMGESGGAAASPLSAAQQHDQLERKKKKGFLNKVGQKVTAGVKRLSRKSEDQGVTTPAASPVRNLSSPSPSGRLYGRDLKDLISSKGADAIPGALQGIISRLYYDGPMAMGLFRKSANARAIKQVRHQLESDEEVDWLGLPVLVVGAVLKEFLRSLPDSVMTLTLYPEFVACNSISDAATRVQKVGSVLKKLPSSHLELLRALIPMFVRICDAGEANGMTAGNVGICIGQSLMWPSTMEDILKNDVPPFIEVRSTSPLLQFSRCVPSRVGRHSHFHLA